MISLDFFFFFIFIYFLTTKRASICIFTSLFLFCNITYSLVFTFLFGRTEMAGKKGKRQKTLMKNKSVRLFDYVKISGERNKNVCSLHLFFYYIANMHRKTVEVVEWYFVVMYFVMVNRRKMFSLYHLMYY